MKPVHQNPTRGMPKDSYRAIWVNRVKEWQASGLSQVEYAKRQGLSRKQLSQWVNKVRQNKVPQSNGGCKQSSIQPASIIPVRVQANHSPSAGQMKLVLHSGIILECSYPPQAVWLAELLKSLA
ncbi:hypothetical protein DFR44_1522 [Hydromonas duriensis]|uniref:Transposase n=1 Tax=Hydromonas duriensis TaxID=1527608 RepID=A0A4R6Y473_9BURK|nr:helix-turn-helix transcriptional regulator [Hydromonas duriensis]TDR27033.1 hypothetical protein DFR44_1522 [Hydromonas duriensis]